MQYDLNARQLFVDRMSDGIRVGLNLTTLQKVVELAALQHAEITPENAQFWIVPALREDGLPDVRAGKALAVSTRSGSRTNVAIIPINSTIFTDAQIITLGIVYHMMDPYFSD